MDATGMDVYLQEIIRISDGGSPTAADVTAVLAATGAVRTVTVNARGTDYAVGDTLTVGGGTGATFQVTSVGTSGEVLTLSKVAGGTGYDNATGAATTTDGAGTGCTLDTVVEFSITSFTVNDGGADYYSAELDIVKTDPQDVDAETTVTVTDGAVAGVAVDNGGAYLSVPTVNVLPGPTVDATAFQTEMETFDTTQRANRLKDVLRFAMVNHVLDKKVSEQIRTMYNSL